MDRDLWIPQDTTASEMASQVSSYTYRDSFLQSEVYSLSMSHKYIYWAPTTCWVYLPEYSTFVPASMQCLYYFPNLKPIFLELSNFYTIFNASFNFTPSIKYAQTMTVYNHLSHQGCVGTSPHWLTRSKCRSFPNSAVVTSSCSLKSAMIGVFIQWNRQVLQIKAFILRVRY